MTPLLHALAAPYYVAREALSRPRSVRIAEPSALMEDAASVEAFERMGTPGSPLFPYYDITARALNALLPREGHLVDLACGSGRLARYFAQRRADVAITAVDLSEPMLELARRAARDEGVEGRIRFVRHDITALDDLDAGDVDAVSCILSLHQLPDFEAVARCIQGLARLRRRTGCAVWLFDLAAFNHPRTPDAMSLLSYAVADLPEAFRSDWVNSMRAAFSFDEVTACLDATGAGPFFHVRSRWLLKLQAHWATGREGAPELWQAPELTPRVRREIVMVRSLVPGLPGQT